MSKHVNYIASAAFRALYTEHYHFVCSQLRRRGVRDEEVEDLAQETFVIVLRKLPALRKLDEARPWLATIAGFCALSWRRSAARSARKHSTYEQSYNTTQVEFSSEVYAIQNLIRRYMSQMREPELSTFMYKEVFGMTASDIAQYTNTNENTVRSRLRRARQIVNQTALELDSGRRDRGAEETVAGAALAARKIENHRQRRTKGRTGQLGYSDCNHRYVWGSLPTGMGLLEKLAVKLFHSVTGRDRSGDFRS